MKTNRYLILKQPLYLALFSLLFTACGHTPTPDLKSISYGDYEKVTYANIPAWKDEDFSKAFEVFVDTCSITSKHDLFEKSCAKALSTKQDPKSFFESTFTPFASISEKSLATGYFEPTLEGSLTQSPRYPYALYGVPDDLIRIELTPAYKRRLSRPVRGRLIGGSIKPYYSRQEINEDALIKQRPICYVADKVELFFLQVQGSGCIRLDDNSSIYVGYADQNGYPYVSIGKEMINRGMLSREDVSLESIRSYLYDNPEVRDDILNANPSYIFFQERTHRASGSLGLVLHAERSVAVDRKNIPLGMPLFVSTTDPLDKTKFEKIMFAHDTGGAIKGESRIDIFYGSDKMARAKAGKMQNPLKLWILVPNDYLSKQQVK